MNFRIAALALLIAASPACTRVQKPVLTHGMVYSNSDLGFRYTPPDGLLDLTAADKARIDETAAERHTTNVLGLLLSLRSPEEDTAPGWYSVGIETYPRQKLAGTDDLVAETKMNASVAGRKNLDGPAKVVTFAGQKFALSEVEQQEGPLTKHAEIYTTVRGDRLLSFAFSGNSIEKVKMASATMNTLQFSGTGR